MPNNPIAKACSSYCYTSNKELVALSNGLASCRTQVSEDYNYSPTHEVTPFPEYPSLQTQVCSERADS